MAANEDDANTEETNPRLSNEGLAFRSQFLRQLGITPDQSLVVVANDETMAPRIRAGDTLIINNQDRELVDGRIYGLLVEGRMRLRRYCAPPPRFECSMGSLLSLATCTIIGRVVYRSGPF